MYNLIHYSKLIEGQRYLIKDIHFINYQRFATFKRYSFYLGYTITIWQRIKYTTYLTINKTELIEYSHFGDLYLSIDESDYIYELVSEKKAIQKSMEQRAINLILQNIIGDKNFTYSI
uniref:Uncharacterized protein n=1 Tax=viral metagenome TaxID=1070528 RepID=A0A6C0EV74_9ZZZZ